MCSYAFGIELGILHASFHSSLLYSYDKIGSNHILPMICYLGFTGFMKPAGISHFPKMRYLKKAGARILNLIYYT